MEKKDDIINNTEAVDIIENNIVARWLKETAKNNPLLFSRLIGDNTRRYKKYFGEPKFEKGKDNYWQSGWIINDLGIPLVILTGTNGTIYKIYYPGGKKAYVNDRKLSAAITQFLLKIVNENILSLLS